VQQAVNLLQSRRETIEFQKFLLLLEAKYEEAKDKLVKCRREELEINQARAQVYDELHSLLVKPTPQFATPKEG
jgi:hypothetical protein